MINAVYIFVQTIVFGYIIVYQSTIQFLESETYETQYVMKINTAILVTISESRTLLETPSRTYPDLVHLQVLVPCLAECVVFVHAETIKCRPTSHYHHRPFPIHSTSSFLDASTTTSSHQPQRFVTTVRRQSKHEGIYGLYYVCDIHGRQCMQRYSHGR